MTGKETPPVSRLENNFVLVMGVAGTGKTEIARRLAMALDGSFLEADTLHSPENVASMSRGIALTDADRWPWLQAVCDAAIEQEVRPVVIACSALKRSYRDFIRERLGPVTLLHLTGSATLISERLKNRRGHFATLSLHESQMRTLEPPAEDEQPILLDISRTPEAIVDFALDTLKTPATFRHDADAG